MINRPDTNAQRLKRHKRVRGKISGTPERPRLNVFRSATNIYAQIIDDVTGKTLVSASSLEKDFSCEGTKSDAAKQVGINVAERAKAKGIDYKVGKFSFQAIGKAVAAGETEGFVKLLFGRENGELLGAHIVGDQATELSATPELALNAELTDADLEAMIYAHPTLSEALHEAVLAADGRALHA